MFTGRIIVQSLLTIFRFPQIARKGLKIPKHNKVSLVECFFFWCSLFNKSVYQLKGQMQKNLDIFSSAILKATKC